MSDEGVECYVARKPCGCYVAASVDRPEYRKDTAKTLAEWIRAGLIVERKTVGWVRAGGLAPCKCDEDSAQEALPL